MRKATITRNTAETQIEVTIDLDGTGRTDIAVTIGLLEATIKMALYYFHERMWNRLNVGRKPITDSHPTGAPALASPSGKPA